MKMANKIVSNKDLQSAKNAKKDEFYTQREDIDKEIPYYKPLFKDKVVYCNCDDPYKSKFVEYFIENFNELGLRKLICTNWNGSPLSPIAYKWEISEVKDYRDMASFLASHKPSVLNGDGDFRSEECIALLEEADIVVTNPPFSLFREFMKMLIKYKKQFLIIGNMNAITYKDIFPLIIDGKMWYGPSISSGDRKFNVPDDYDLNAAGCGVDYDGKKFIRVKGVRWFTNLDHKKRHEWLELEKEYDPNLYPKYDNYDAICVSKTKDIPKGYDGVMGVPISFLDKYCPEQFFLLGITENNPKNEPYQIYGFPKYDRPYLNGKRKYPCLFIKRVYGSFCI